jgi:hypothetical protein
MTEKTGLEIVKSTYGVTPNFVDVTKTVKDMVKNGELSFTPSAQELGIVDPAPGVKKVFQVQYIINGGKKQLLQIDEGSPVLISAPPNEKKKEFSVAFGVYTVIWYFLLSICTSFFGYSAYQLGMYGFKNKIVAYLLAILAGGTFILYGAGSETVGILGFVISFPVLVSIIPLTVFAYSLYDNIGIDFSYSVKNVV